MDYPLLHSSQPFPSILINLMINSISKGHRPRTSKSSPSASPPPKDSAVARYGTSLCHLQAREILLASIHLFSTRHIGRHTGKPFLFWLASAQKHPRPIPSHWPSHVKIFIRRIDGPFGSIFSVSCPLYGLVAEFLQFDLAVDALLCWNTFVSCVGGYSGPYW